MASSPITSWQIEGKKVETMTDLILLGSENTVDGDCSHKIKRCLLLGRKAMKSLNHILKAAETLLWIKGHQCYSFPVVMYRCDGWTIKKTEHWKIDALKMWCWRRLLKVPWTTRRANWSIPKESNTEYSLEGLRLKLQYFAHLMRTADSLENTLMLGKIEGKRRREWQRITWLDSNTCSKEMNWSNLLEVMENKRAWRAIVHGVAKSQICLSRLEKNNKSTHVWLTLAFSLYLSN